jgi:large subunit ribosomal protein L4
VTVTANLVGANGRRSGSVELPADVFDAQANIPLMHQVVVAQLAAARQGTHKTKTRGEVSGGGRKPYKQKGTGRARQGSIRAPQFTGGGVVHGPQPRDYSQRVPKKMKAAALRGALSDRARGGRVHVVESFVDGETPKTSAALATLRAVTESVKVLVVLDRDDDVNWLSLRNAPEVHLIVADQLNTYDVLVADDVVFTRDALEEFLGVAPDVTEVEPGEDEDDEIEEPAAVADVADESDADAEDADAADEEGDDSDQDDQDDENDDEGEGKR